MVETCNEALLVAGRNIDASGRGSAQIVERGLDRALCLRGIAVARKIETIRIAFVVLIETLIQRSGSRVIGAARSRRGFSLGWRTGTADKEKDKQDNRNTNGKLHGFARISR